MNRKVVSGWNRTLELYIMSYKVLFGSETAVMNWNTQTHQQGGERSLK